MHTQGMLTTQDLCIGYAVRKRPPRIVAANLELTIHAGDLICLLGPNGIGKSTLLRTITGMQPTLSGAVLLDGVDLATLAPRDLARRLSLVLTERVDVGQLSVYALVSLGRHPYTDWLGRLTPQDEHIVQQSLEAVDAVSLAHRPFHQLSDGERQRVLLARALAQQPRLLVLDEPTAFLDLPRRIALMHLLRQLAHSGERAILLSTHDLDLALRYADVLWLMQRAGTVHVGAPEDLILNGAFATTFHHEGVIFDPATGAFQVNAATTAPVCLRGQGLPAHWTTHALERAGFCVVRQPDTSADVVIDITPGDHGLTWGISQAGQTYTVSSLYDLVALLRAMRANAPTPPQSPSAGCPELSYPSHQPPDEPASAQSTAEYR